jgi:hypothetical protein
VRPAAAAAATAHQNGATRRAIAYAGKTAAVITAALMRRATR